MTTRYDARLFNYFDQLERRLRLAPLNLGAIAASGGGSGSRPGGYINWLPQGRVAYDYSEAESLTVPASGASLLDNLNHIRYRIAYLETYGGGPGSGGGAISVEDDTVEIDSAVTVLNFGAGLSVTDDGIGQVTVDCTVTSGVGGVTHVSAATGFREYGGTTPKYLIHEAAFQLDSAGNARGTGAVDLQQSRSNVAMVAGGIYSSILGGIDNKAAGTYSLAGGRYCVASGADSMAIGLAAFASSARSIALGEAAIAHNTSSLVFGGTDYGVGTGYFYGENQAGIYNKCTYYDLFDGNWQSLYTINLPVDFMMGFHGMMVVYESGASNRGLWEFKGLVSRISSGDESLDYVTNSELYCNDANWEFECYVDTSEFGNSLRFRFRDLSAPASKRIYSKMTAWTTETKIRTS